MIVTTSQAVRSFMCELTQPGSKRIDCFNLVKKLLFHHLISHCGILFANAGRIISLRACRLNADSFLLHSIPNTWNNLT